MRKSSSPLTEVVPRLASREELERVHASTYIDEVLIAHQTSQWSDTRPDLSELAATFVGGTIEALNLLLDGSTKTVIHFPGAKHYAQYDHSSGFCIFADFAIAADIATKEFAKKVAILDFDAHHGDGTENLTASNPNVISFSIHEWGIFPGTGSEDLPEMGIYNSPLDNETGKGDAALIREVSRFVRLTEQFDADIILFAAGADGYAEDPLSSLQFTLEGYKQVAQLLRKAFPQTPMLIGGAGGYLPDSRTPEIWSNFAHQISIN